MRTALVLGAALALIPLGSTAFAGMQQDLRDCPDPNRANSAAACTRILASGRLPRSQHYIAYYNRAWAYRLAGQQDLAIADYDRAYQQRPSFEKTLLSRGVLLREMGNYTKSLDDLDAYVVRKAGDWSGYFHRAWTKRALDRGDEALGDIGEAVARNPKESKIKILQALLLAELGDPANARDIIEPIAAAEPDNNMARYVRAVALYENGSDRDAEATVDAALAAEPRFTAARVLLGRIQERRGERSAARSTYNAAMKEPAKSFDATRALATARDRLAALDGVRPPASVVVTQAPIADGVSGVAGRTCRRYVPAAAATITVDCGE